MNRALFDWLSCTYELGENPLDSISLFENTGRACAWIAQQAIRDAVETVQKGNDLGNVISWQADRVAVLTRITVTVLPNSKAEASIDKV